MSVRFVWYKAAANPSFFSTIMLTAGYSRPLAVSLSLQASSIFIVLPFLHKIPSQKNRNTKLFMVILVVKKVNSIYRHLIQPIPEKKIF